MSEENTPVKSEPKQSALSAAIAEHDSKAKLIKDGPLKKWLQSGFRAFLWVAAGVVLWNAICFFDFLSFSTKSVGTMVLAMILFFLSLPLGIIFRLDEALGNVSVGEHPEYALFAALPYVLINFGILSIYLGFRRQRKAEQKKEKK